MLNYLLITQVTKGDAENHFRNKKVANKEPELNIDYFMVSLLYVFCFNILMKHQKGPGTCSERLKLFTLFLTAPPPL